MRRGDSEYFDGEPDYTWGDHNEIGARPRWNTVDKDFRPTRIPVSTDKHPDGVPRIFPIIPPSLHGNRVAPTTGPLTPNLAASGDSDGTPIDEGADMLIPGLTDGIYESQGTRPDGRVPIIMPINIGPVNEGIRSAGLSPVVVWAAGGIVLVVLLARFGGRK